MISQGTFSPEEIAQIKALACQLPAERGMSQTPYRTAKRVFWIIDNGSSHRGEPFVERLEKKWTNATAVHLPIHASPLNQVEIYFAIVQRKVLTPNDFPNLRAVKKRLHVCLALGIFKDQGKNLLRVGIFEDQKTISSKFFLSQGQNLYLRFCPSIKRNSVYQLLFRFRPLFNSWHKLCSSCYKEVMSKVL